MFSMAKQFGKGELSMSESLTKIETGELEAIEHRIEECLDAVVELGRQLARVNLSRLYRQPYGTFEAYCWKRWRISRTSAYQFMGAAETADYLFANGEQLLPENERQYRSLGQLPIEERLGVWQLALAGADGEQPAAANIADLVAQRMACMSDQEQLQVTAGEQDQVAAQMRGQTGRVKSFYRVLTKFEREVFAWRARHPERVAVFGEERFNRLVAEVVALEQMEEGAGK
jgi:hypothetical protein